MGANNHVTVDVTEEDSNTKVTYDNDPHGRYMCSLRLALIRRGRL